MRARPAVPRDRAGAVHRRWQCQPPLPAHPDDLPRAALALLLALHPAQLSVEELERELGSGPHAVADALADLAAAGLLHRHGRFVFLTRAAVRAHELSA